jgi:PAS domain S-box-containing protein
MSARPKKTILLVEDEALIALAEAQTIEGFGYNVLMAKSGEKAVEIATGNESPDLILMDIDLGKGISGPEAAAAILAKTTIPIVFLTSHSEREMVEKVRGITRYGYVIKNSGDFVLQSSIEMAFELFEANMRQSRELVIRKNIEDELTAREKVLLEAEIVAGLGSYVLDIRTGTWKSSAMLDQVFGIDGSYEHTIAGWTALIHPDDREMMTSYLVNDVIGAGQTFDREYRIINHRTGAERIVYGKGKLDRDEANRPIIMYGAIQDVTQQRNATAALMESEAHFRALFEKAIDGIIYMSPEAELTEVNESFARLHGYTVSELRNKRIQDLDVEATSDLVAQRMERLRAGESLRFEVQHYHKDGHIIHFEVATSMMVLNRRTHIVAFHRDITERKRAEKHIEEIITKNPMSIQILDKDGFTVEVNDSFKSLFGSVPPPGYSIFDDPQFARRGLSDIFGKLRSGEIVHFPDVCFNPRESISDLQDVPVWTRTIGFPLSDSNDRPEMFVLMHENITDRKRAEEQLQEMSKRLQLAAASAKAGVWDWNLKTNEMIWDERMYELYGFTHENFPGGIQAWEGGLHPDDASRAIEECQSALRGEREFDTQFRVRHPDGTVLYIKANGLVLRGEGGEPVRMIGLNTDITGRTRAEMRIESLLAERGVLLKEVHHRIKNNMYTMMSLLSLQAKAMADPGCVEALDGARRRMQSMMVLYDKLYRSEGFSELSLQKYLVPLVHEIIANSPNNEMITIETEVEDFILDARQLSPLGIIINELIINMMKHAFVGRDRGVICIAASLKDRRATIVVQDNGIGLPEGFGLKSSSGFGLRLVDMLTDQLDGSMKIERENGTRFILTFEV